MFNPSPTKPKHPPTHNCMRLLNPLEPAPVCQCQRKCHCLSLPPQTVQQPAHARQCQRKTRAAALLSSLPPHPLASQPALVCQCKWTDRCCCIHIPFPTSKGHIPVPPSIHKPKQPPTRTCMPEPEEGSALLHTYPCPYIQPNHQPAPVCKRQREDPCCRAAVLRSVGLALKAVA